MADSAVRTSGDVSEHPRSRPSSSMAEDGSLSSSRSRPQTPRDLGIKPKIYNTPESLTVEEAYEKIYSCSSRSRYRRRATATPAAAPAPSGKGNNNGKCLDPQLLTLAIDLLNLVHFFVDLFRLVEDGIIKVSEDKKEIDPESIASYKRLTGLLSSELEIEPLNDPSIASYEKLTGIPTSDLDIDREPLSSPSVASYEKLTGIPTDLDIDRESPTGNPSIASYEKLTGIPTSDFDREPSNNQTATTLSKNIENIDCLPVSITPQKKTNLTPSPQKNIKSPGIKSPPGKGSDRESTKLPEDGKLVDRGRQQKSGKTPNRGITTPQKPVGPKQDLPVSSTSSRPANNGTTTSLPRKARALSPSPMRGVKKSSPSSFRSALSRNESPASSSGQSTATQKPAFSTGFKTPVNSKIPLALTPKYTPKFCKTFKATPRPLKAPLKPENDPKAVVEPVKLSPMPSLTVPQAKVTVAEPPKSTPKTAATKPVPKIEPTKPTPKTDPTSTKPTPKIEPTSAKPTPKPEPTSTKPTPKTEPTTPPKSIMKTSALIKRQPLSVSATSPRSTGSYLERHGKMELAKKPDNITERIKRRVKIDVPVSPKQSSASANLSSDPLAEDKPMVTKSDTIPMSKADADQPQARGPQPDPPSNSLMPDANINMDENKTLCRVDSVPGISEQVTPTLYDSEEEELKFGNNNSIKISPLPVPTIVATVQENVDKKKAIASKSNVTVVDVKDTTPTPGVMTPCRFNVAGCRGKS